MRPEPATVKVWYALERVELASVRIARQVAQRRELSKNGHPTRRAQDAFQRFQVCDLLTFEQVCQCLRVVLFGSHNDTITPSVHPGGRTVPSFMRSMNAFIRLSAAHLDALSR